MFRVWLSCLMLVIAAAAASCGEAAPPAAGPLPSPTATVLVRVSPPPKPSSVPATAAPIVQTSTLGRITRRAGQPPQTVALRRLTDAGCVDGVMTLQTSQESIYAALTCDRFWDDAAKELFLGKDAALVLEVSLERFRILIETVEGAQGEFTVEGIWVQ